MFSVISGQSKATKYSLAYCIKVKSGLIFGTVSFFENFFHRATLLSGQFFQSRLKMTPLIKYNACGHCFDLILYAKTSVKYQGRIWFGSLLSWCIVL